MFSMCIVLCTVDTFSTWFRAACPLVACSPLVKPTREQLGVHPSAVRPSAEFSPPGLFVQVAKTLNERISQYAQVTLESLAYAGTGDVLKVQQLLALCAEHEAVEEDTAWKVRAAALVATTIKT